MQKYNRKILFITSTFPSSDSDPVPGFVKDEAIWLNKVYGYQVDVLAPHNAYSKTTSYQKHKHYDEYRFHYFFPFKFELLAGRGIEPALQKNKLLYFQLPFFFIFEFFSLMNHSRKTKPDIIYAHWFTPQAIMSYLVSKMLGIPFVFDTQASDVIVLKRIPFSRKIIDKVCCDALSYTAPSKMTADKLEYFTTERNRKKIMDKLTIVPMGTKIPSEDKEALVSLSKDINPKNKKVILFMGRLVDRKGVDTLIKAFSEVLKSNNEHELFIAGDGQEAHNLRTLVKKLDIDDKVHFLGYVSGSRKFNLLYLADIYALPSINVGDQAEGLPIAFMEAVSAGCTTVISDATGAHEVAKDGENTFIFKAGSVEDLKSKLLKAMDLNSKQKKEFKQSVLKFSKRFQWEEIIKERHDALSLDK